MFNILKTVEWKLGENMEKIFSLTLLTLALSACGGGSDNNSNVSTIDTSNPTPTQNQALSKLQVNDPSLGQRLTFGSNTNSNLQDLVANKKYFARYAYCEQTCKIGEMNFVIQRDGTNLKIDSINVDKLGEIYVDNQDIPRYKALQTGSVSAISSITLEDSSTNRYNLKLKPVYSVEDKIPSNVDVDIYFNNDGMHIAGADEDYLFAAQQMNNAPTGWKNDATKVSVAGNWRAFETDDNLKVLNKSSIAVQTNEILQGASSLFVNGTKGNYNGYYKNLGSGYVLGYTDDNQPLRNDGYNYDGISGLIITAPDNQFAIGYDGEDDQSFLLFR